MPRKFLTLGVTLIALSSLAFAADTAPSTAPDTSTKPAEKDKEKTPTTISGTGKFGGGPVTWTAKFTPTKTPGVYDATYLANWGGNKNMGYTGQITSDFKTEIKCFGKSNGTNGGNGSFEFSAKFDEKGIASSTYKEIGGNRGRSGPIAADLNTLK